MEQKPQHPASRTMNREIEALLRMAGDMSAMHERVAIAWAQFVTFIQALDAENKTLKAQLSALQKQEKDAKKKENR